MYTDEKRRWENVTDLTEVGAPSEARRVRSMWLWLWIFAVVVVWTAASKHATVRDMFESFVTPRPQPTSFFVRAMTALTRNDDVY
jgi:hypothetical protein